MKIALVSEHANPLAVTDGAPAGGQHVLVGGLAAALAHRGDEVTVYTRRDSRDRPERVAVAPGYTVVNVAAGPAKSLSDTDVFGHTGAFAECLDAQWSTDRPDVAHAFCWMSGLATQLAARAYGVPTVQTFGTLVTVEHQHGEQSSNVDARLKLEKLVAKHATWVAATCTDDAFELIRLGRARSSISVVPCGVDTDTFSVDGSAIERGAHQRIIAVGKMLPRNGFDTVIQALPNIPDAEYVIVGGPERKRLARDPEVRRLRALAAELGVADRVVFMGAVPHRDMPAVLRSADVVTCTPSHDSLGLVSLEAMACGVPVVGSAVGGMLDTVVNDVTGQVVPTGRPRECAEVLTTILRDSFLRRSLGLAGRDRACARFSWDRAAVDASRTYEHLTADLTHQMARSGWGSSRETRICDRHV